MGMDFISSFVIKLVLKQKGDYIVTPVFIYVAWSMKNLH